MNVQLLAAVCAGVMPANSVPLLCFQGDVILHCEHIFEVVSKLCVLANKQNLVKVVQGR